MFGALQYRCPGVSRRRSARRAFSLTWVVIPLGIAAAVSALWATGSFTHSRTTDTEGLLLHRVVKDTFLHDVTEPGEVESSDNVEVKCEVKARNNSQGMKILWIIEPGAIVKPGDLLVKFDSSSLEDERAQQQIVVNNSEALVIQSKNVYETAEIAKQEYLNGTFKQEEQVAQSEIFVAEETLRRAEQYAQYSQRLAAKGYVTTLQLEADRFAVDKARKDLQASQTKLNVLQNFTQAKMIKTLESDIQTAKAKLVAAENSFKIDTDKLKFLDDQVSKCQISAPKPGKVVYANRMGGRDDRDVIIEEGALIREGQPVIRLPDLEKMQVSAKINESRIGLMRVGMEATIRLDAFPDAPLDGTVIRVDEYPLPGNFFNGNVKQYGTYVQIHGTTPGMRPGLTAVVQIHIDALPDVISVPVQAIIERDKQHFCLVVHDGQIEPRSVQIGETNNDAVVVKSGLEVDEQIVLDANSHLSKVKLPESPDSDAKDQSVKSGAERRHRSRANGDTPDSAVADGKPAAGKPSDPAALADNLLKQFDKDHDGALSQSEVPAEQRAQLADADVNHDGKIDRAELLAAVTKRLASRGGDARALDAPPRGDAQ